MRRTPLPPETLSADTKHLYELLSEGADASVIIVAVSYVDACLASLLAKHLLESSVTDKLLNSQSGAIGSFGVRSDLAYSLGLIDKLMYQDLLVLAKLRNITAHHHFELSFASAEIARDCAELKYVATCFAVANAGGPSMGDEWIAGPRDRFVLTATMIVDRLLLTALKTSHTSQGQIPS